MNFNYNLDLKCKVVNIYYLKKKDSLQMRKFTISSNDERVTIEEAKKVLDYRKVEYSEILKVVTEYENLRMPLTDYKSYVVNQ